MEYFAPLQWLLDRLKEGSTWAGFAAIAVMLGISPDLWASISQIGPEFFGVVCSILALIFKDKVAS